MKTNSFEGYQTPAQVAHKLGMTVRGVRYQIQRKEIRDRASYHITVGERVWLIPDEVANAMTKANSGRPKTVQNV